MSLACRTKYDKSDLLLADLSHRKLADVAFKLQLRFSLCWRNSLNRQVILPGKGDDFGEVNL